MAEINLTDRTFWQQYCANYQYEKIPRKAVFQPYVERLKGKRSFIEIGGFPGTNAAFFYKNICKNVSLLDFYIDKQMVNRFEEYNNLPTDAIQCIESYFFKFSTNEKYDIVFSLGFIEHFKDTDDVVNRHANLLSDKGILLIVLPNFRDLNGLVQYLFDKNNFTAHNLKSMNIKYLRSIAANLGLNNIEVSYTRKPMLWLEPKPTSGNKIARKIIKIFSHMLKLFPIKCRLLSPYIIIYAEK